MSERQTRANWPSGASCRLAALRLMRLAGTGTRGLLDATNGAAGKRDERMAGMVDAAAGFIGPFAALITRREFGRARASTI
jgi:hypothetical protein